MDQGSRGIGQAVMAATETWCREHFAVSRIWLDVFEDNARARHVYRKLGYQWFKTEPFQDRTLHFYEKVI